MAAQAALYGGMAALQIAGGYFASQNIRATAALNRDIAEMNAEFAELDAYDALVEGYTQQARYQAVIDQTLAEQQLMTTAQGIDANYGTAAALREENKFIAELNLMEIEKQAQERSLGYQSQARQYRMGGQMQQAQANIDATNVMYGSITNAVKTGVTGYERGL